jgi:tetratricopeptide (TPR) repeat protein
MTGDFMEAMLDQAQAHLKKGEFERAVEEYTACLSSKGDEVSALRGRGIAHFQLKKWNEAISDFSKARDLDSTDLESWVGLGMSLAMDLKVYPAIEVLETLLEKHPDYARGHLQLGLLYFRLCVTAKGRHHLEKALACRPTLMERRIIEKTLKEQKQLDKRRLYRPDFEALRRQNQEEERV